MKKNFLQHFYIKRKDITFVEEEKQIWIDGSNSGPIMTQFTSVYKFLETCQSCFYIFIIV